MMLPWVELVPGSSGSPTTQSVVFHYSEGQIKQIRNNDKVDFVPQDLQLVLNCNFAERRLKLEPLAEPFIDLTLSQLT